MKHQPLTIEERARINAGWQCGECYGVNITRRAPAFGLGQEQFTCRECGCQWTPIRIEDQRKA